MIKRNSPENILKRIAQLDVVEFLGICKILNVRLYNVDITSEKKEDDKEQMQPRDFTEIWSDLCDKVENLNRTRRRNLARLVNAATGKED